MQDPTEESMEAAYKANPWLKRKMHYEALADATMTNPMWDGAKKGAIGAGIVAAPYLAVKGWQNPYTRVPAVVVGIGAAAAFGISSPAWWHNVQFNSTLKGQEGRIVSENRNNKIFGHIIKSMEGENPISELEAAKKIMQMKNLGNAGKFAGRVGLGAAKAMAYIPGKAAKALWAGAGGPAGIGGGIIGGATALGVAAVSTAKAGERIARFMLTGTSKDPLDAWLPNFKTASGIAKFAPNPSIARRLAIGGLAKAAFAPVSEMLGPHAAPATAFFDGRYMHHRNDMGANAQYGNAVLGSNSMLNANDYLSVLPHLF